MERRESRPMPQMPWPLVQPLPRRVPMPTSSPASSTSGQPGRVVNVGMLAQPRLSASQAPRPQSQQEEQPPGRPVLQRTGQNAADPGHPAVEQHQDQGREPHQHAAAQREQPLAFHHRDSLISE